MPMSEITDLHDFRKLPVGDFVTLAGFVLAQLGMSPRPEISSFRMNGVFGSSQWTAGGSTRYWSSPHEAGAREEAMPETAILLISPAPVRC